MQHHHSRVSQSLQPTIDSLPSISDLSLNLISFSPTSQECGYGPVHSYVFEWLRVDGVYSVCLFFGGRQGGACVSICVCEVFSEVNSVPNQVFIIAVVVLWCVSVNHTHPRRIFLWEFQRCSDSTSSRPLLMMPKCRNRPLFASSFQLLDIKSLFYKHSFNMLNNSL